MELGKNQFQTFFVDRYTMLPECHANLALMLDCMILGRRECLL